MSQPESLLSTLFSILVTEQHGFEPFAIYFLAITFGVIVLNQCLVNQMGLSILTFSVYHCFTALKFAHDIGSCQLSDSR